MVAGCPLAAIDREVVNREAVADCRTAGMGLYVRALRRQLRKRGIEVPFVEHDLIAEMNGIDQPLKLDDRRQAIRVLPSREARKSYG